MRHLLICFALLFCAVASGADPIPPLPVGAGVEPIKVAAPRPAPRVAPTPAPAPDRHAWYPLAGGPFEVWAVLYDGQLYDIREYRRTTPVYVLPDSWYRPMPRQAAPIYAPSSCSNGRCPSR